MHAPQKTRDISSIGLIMHQELRITTKLSRILGKTKNCEMYFDPVAAEKLNQQPTEIKDMNADVVLVFGGDGTLLWTINEIQQKHPVVLGVNTGRVGYLSELTIKNLNSGVDKLLRGEYYLDERSKLLVNEKNEALNEAAVFPYHPAALLEFKIFLNNIKISEFRSDGVLVSTQTGSTGYSLSLSGPVIHPDANAYVITPINPFMRIHAPIVVPDTASVAVELIRKKRDAYLVLDGRVIDILHPDDRITIRKSRNTVRFVRFEDNARNRNVAYTRVNK